MTVSASLTFRKLVQLTVCLIVVGGILAGYYFSQNGFYQYASEAGLWTDNSSPIEQKDILTAKVTLPVSQTRTATALPVTNGSTYDPEHVIKADGHSRDSKAVILFSYMRSGSSFVGNALFNMDPNAYYAFEPLASLYGGMYGLDMFSVVDTDLIFWANGTIRAIPSDEVETINWMLSNLLTCNLTSFPPEIHRHLFWEWSNGLSNYSKCVKSHRVQGNLQSCREHIKPVCGDYFAGRGIDTAARCFRNLWQPFWRRISTSKENRPTSNLVDDKDTIKFKLYHDCLALLKEPVSECQGYLQETCRASTIRATKIIRGSMGPLDKLMELMPNLYIVHLFRDPRGVVRSRLHKSWSQGYYDGNDVSKLAQTYCKRVAMDTHQRKLMQRKYPNRIMELVYDKIAEDPYKNLQAVYKFLGIDMSLEAVVFIQRSVQTLKESKNKWSKELSNADIAKIQLSCQEFTTETGFDWERFNVAVRGEPKNITDGN